VKDFWPQEWLPKDPAFKNVRIHSFGYDSDWAKEKVNFLNISHFGKSLLGQMSTLPCLRDADTPIVLIGHSMGGLVIKKAYNLARQSAAYEPLANRVHSIYFVATPHSGSDSAKLLSNLLQFASIPANASQSSNETPVLFKQSAMTLASIRGTSISGPFTRLCLSA
jgi:triacylglycerol esterase/lipase EstA (alpha/beta hydrolase family)